MKQCLIVGHRGNLLSATCTYYRPPTSTYLKHCLKTIFPRCNFYFPLNFDITIKYYVFIDISGLSIVFIIIILKASMVWRVAYFTARLSSGRSIVPLRLYLRRTKWQFWEFQTIDTNPLTIRVNISTDFIPPAIDDKGNVATLHWGLLLYCYCSKKLLKLLRIAPTCLHN